MRSLVEVRRAARMQNPAEATRANAKSVEKPPPESRITFLPTEVTHNTRPHGDGRHEKFKNCFAEVH